MRGKSSFADVYSYAISMHKSHMRKILLGENLETRGTEKGETASMAKTKTHQIEVVRHGDKFILPESMSLQDGINVLSLKIQEEEQDVAFSAEIDASPWDGAYAMSKAMERLFGVSIARGKMGWMGEEPPQSFSIEIDADGHTVQVPWGRFKVPGIAGYLETSYAVKDGHIIFAVAGVVKFKHKEKFDKLVALTKELVLTESIYRGKAFRIEFTSDSGKKHAMPVVRFIDVRRATRPIYNKHLEDQLEHDVLAYLKASEQIKRLQGGVLKRGVLLAGPYGTGKTLAANYVAKVAEEHGFTFVYTKSTDVPEALSFARTYLPCVVFAEDIDSVAGSERTDEVNKLLNQLDGIDAKRHDIIFIATTNHIDTINAAMLRPGRIDVVMVIDPPDQEAAIRVARFYAGDLMAENEDFTEAGQLLNGLIPATIQEAVRRAQIRALGRTSGESPVINNIDLAGAARTVIRERDLVSPKDIKSNPVVDLGTALGESAGRALGEALSPLRTPFAPVAKALRPPAKQLATAKRGTNHDDEEEVEEEEEEEE